MDADWDNADQLALQNGAQNRLIFYIAPQFQANKRLFNNFYWFCQVQRYMATPVMNEDNANTRKEFQNVQRRCSLLILFLSFKRY